MSNVQLMQGWLADLSKTLESDYTFDEKGVCTLAFDDDLCVSLTPSTADEALFIVAGPVLALSLDPAVDERLLKAALKLNFLGAETAGGSLALSAYNGMLVFAHTLRFDDCDAVMLKNVIETMADAIIRLRTEITSSLTGSAV